MERSSAKGAREAQMWDNPEGGQLESAVDDSVLYKKNTHSVLSCIQEEKKKAGTNAAESEQSIHYQLCTSSRRPLTTSKNGPWSGSYQLTP